MEPWPDRATGHLPPARATLDAGVPISRALSLLWLRALYETPLLLSVILDQQGRVVDANHLSVEGCGLVRAEVIGRPFWACGWWSRDRDLSEEVRGWCERALSSGEPFRTTGRYFLSDGTEHMVDLSLHPVVDEAGEVSIVATGLDVTGSLRAEASVHRRLAQLARAALDLVHAETVGDLAEIVLDRGLASIEADGGAIVVAEADGYRLAVSERLGPLARARYRRLPFDSTFPGAEVARTGQAVVLATRASGIARNLAMAGVYETTGREAWVFVPLRVGARLIGSLAVAWVDERSPTADELDLVHAFAAQCAQALDRIQVTAANKVASGQVAQMVTSMQQSLLTRPPSPEGLDIAVRYVPAIRQAQVGGDWYDAFTTASGATVVSVGDVAGHDGNAAATMAQLRNLLRGLAMASDHPPGQLLGALDRAVAGLSLELLATALVVRLEDGAGTKGPEVPMHLSWSSAGHLPAIVRQGRPGGSTGASSARLLRAAPDLPLGVDPACARVGHAVELEGPAALLLYTDGLVERRGENLEVSLAHLVEVFAALEGESADDLCDQLLEAMLPEPPDDDVAVLVLRRLP